MKLNEMAERAHAMSREKGWYEDERNIPEMLALIHSEVSEALEDYRHYKREELASSFIDDNNKPIGFPTELADIVIRVGDLAVFLGIDLEQAVFEKMKFNATRSHRHGGKNC